jgi:hypothetical protein
MLARLAILLAMAAAPAAAEQITGATYGGETTRYPHGALGDPIEHDSLTVTTDQGRSLTLRWSDQIVFEDTAPRLADLDGDNAPEVLTVESHESFGARLAVYRLGKGGLSLAAATPFIGQRFRWLSVIGAADLDGDGKTEIAYIDRPHLAKTLRLWRYETAGTKATLTPVADLKGLTNHQIGWDYILGGIRTCGSQPEIITADAGWTQIQSTTLGGESLATKSIAPYTGPKSIQGALDCTP